MAPIDSRDTDSLFHVERISQYVSLPPAALSDAVAFPALCASVFSPLLLSYYPPAQGVVLAYQDVDLSDEPPTSISASTSKHAKSKSRREAHDNPDPFSGSESEDNLEGEEEEEKTIMLRAVDEYSAPFLWATASFLIWRPRKNAWIEAHVSSQASTHITLSHLNSFSISVLKQYMPETWTWTPSLDSSNSAYGGSKEYRERTEGYWVDTDGNPVEGALRVRIRDWVGGGGAEGKGFSRIEGSLVSEEEEERVAAAGQEKGKEKERRKKKTKGVLRRQESDRGEASTQAQDDVMEVD